MFNILIILLGLLATPVAAQTCPTRPTGDRSNACASTAFVGNAIQTTATIPITSANPTFQTSWCGTIQKFVSASAQTLVLPSNIAPCLLIIEQGGVGTTTFIGDGISHINSGGGCSSTRGQYYMVTLANYDVDGGGAVNQAYWNLGGQCQ